MKDRIMEHLDTLFASAPKTTRIEELKQELLAGCLDKFDDLCSSGATQQEAFEKVIDGIGDVDELIGEVERAMTFDPRDAEEKRRKRSLLISGGICSYFFAVAIWIVMGTLGSPAVGAGMFFVFCGIGTMLIIFANLTKVREYEKQEDTLVEELKVQMTKGSKEGKLLSMISSTLWAMTAVLYLAVSFITFRWQVTWIIFPFAAGLQCLLTARLSAKAKRGKYCGAYWCFVTTFYFIISFWTFDWAYTWIVFPAAVAVMQAFRLYTFWRSEEAV